MPSAGFVLEAIGLGVLLPGLIAFLILLAMKRAARFWPPFAWLGAPLVLAIAFWVGCMAQELTPLWPSKAGWQWIPYLPFLAAPAGWMCARARWPEATFFVIATTAFAAAFPIIPGFNSMRVTNAFWAFALGEASLLLSLVLQRSADRLPPLWSATALAACALAQSLVIMKSGWATMALVAAIPLGILLAAVIATLRPISAFDAVALRGMAPGFAATSTGLLFNAYVASPSDVPGACYALVLLSPLALALVLLPPVNRLPQRLRIIVPVMAMATLLCFAMIRAFVS